MADRRDGQAYIDQAISDLILPSAPSVASIGGSSVEEDVSDNAPDWGYSSDERNDLPPDSLDADLPSDVSSDMWSIDHEDWELANGDFTKQYNKLRQHQTATTTHTQPLPARNPSKSTAARSAPSATIVNPKTAHDKHNRDKSDRATQDQVLDARTRLVLSGLTNRGIITKLQHCVSTGKEANVYFTVTPDGQPLAVKIYRTSILNFRSRQTYIIGEHRFRGEYSSSKNPRKMIRVWAEKELRNLRRLEQGSVRTPHVIECKENVLVMEFLGNGNDASPRLKDAEIPDDQLEDVYCQVLIAMRRMYQTCQLIHADLSEYNILFHDSYPVIIDVSQSVERDHPRGFDFLRKDISNIKEYFIKRSGGSFNVLSLRHTWEFIVKEDPSVDEANLLEGLRRLPPDLDGTDDAVFLSAFIPRNLAEVFDPERDVDTVKAGQGGSLIYAEMAGLGNGGERRTDEATSDGVADSTILNENDIRPSFPTAPACPAPRGFRHEDRDTKKERKKAVKEEQREKRKQKMPKSDKQRLIKKSGGK